MVYKSAIRIIKTYLDFVFPPYCLFCRELCETKFFCPDCWKLCELPDPFDRCRHCFEEIEQKGSFCALCKRTPHLPVVRAFVFENGAPILRLKESEAFASYAICQWVRLEWPIPDAIIPMPDKQSIEFAKAFAGLLDRPFVKALRGGGGEFEWREESLKEDQELILLEVGNPVENLQKAIFALSESFPKRIFLLSLFHGNDFSFY